MFQIDQDTNAITPLQSQSFTDLGFKERQHLQEWIAKSPTCLGEDLLILQKEFSGFSDTQERLDLLALDKQGGLVIIENKLDETGRDVVWQALKYASYCASLSTDDVCQIYQEHLAGTGQAHDARSRIAEFLDEEDLSDVTLNRGSSQRIMLVAARFRKEVTSTVLWLMNFQLQIQCFKVTPWVRGADLFLNVEQIIPVKDIQEFTIGLARKAQEEMQTSSAARPRAKLRQEFWAQLLRVMQEKSDLCDQAAAPTGRYLRVGSGLRGVNFYFGVSKKYGGVELSFERGDRAENDALFDQLSAQKTDLEQALGETLRWERMETRSYCCIIHGITANVYARDDWPQMIAFMTKAMVRMEAVFREPLQKLKPK